MYFVITAFSDTVILDEVYFDGTGGWVGLYSVTFRKGAQYCWCSPFFGCFIENIYEHVHNSWLISQVYVKTQWADYRQSQEQEIDIVIIDFNFPATINTTLIAIYWQLLSRHFRPIYCCKKYLRKDGRQAHSYNGRLIGNRIRAFDWYQFRWPWMTVT